MNDAQVSESGVFAHEELAAEGTFEHRLFAALLPSVAGVGTAVAVCSSTLTYIMISHQCFS